MKTLTIIKRALSLTKAKTIAYAPELLVVAGAGATIAACVFVSKNDYKFKEVLENYKETKQTIEDVEAKNLPEYTEEDAKNDMKNAVIDLGKGFVSAYWPAIASGAFAIGCNVASLCIQKRRLTALGIAYSSAVASFAAYRQAVIDKFGEAADRAILYGEETVELVDTVDGKPKAVEYVKSDRKICDTLRRFVPDDAVFAGCGANFAPMYASAIEHFAGVELESKGYMFLNELNSELGYYYTLTKEEIAQGQVLGWVYDPSKAWDQQFKIKTTKAVVDGVKGIYVEYPAPINLLGYLKGGKMRNA